MPHRPRARSKPQQGPASDEARDPSLDGLTDGRRSMNPGDRQSKPLGDVFERVRVRERPELLQALVLDLANPLARDVERAPHLVECPRMLAVEPVAELED